MQVREQYQLEIPSRFAGLENLDSSECTKRAGENMRENSKTLAEERKQYKQWFDEEYS